MKKNSRSSVIWSAVPSKYSKIVVVVVTALKKEALMGTNKVSTKLVGDPTYLGPMVYQLSRNEIICVAVF